MSVQIVRLMRPQHWFVCWSEKVVRPVHPQHLFVCLSGKIVRPLRPRHKSNYQSIYKEQGVLRAKQASPTQELSKFGAKRQFFASII